MLKEQYKRNNKINSMGSDYFGVASMDRIGTMKSFKRSGIELRSNMWQQVTAATVLMSWCYQIVIISGIYLLRTAFTIGDLPTSRSPPL